VDFEKLMEAGADEFFTELCSYHAIAYDNEAAAFSRRLAS